MKITEVVNILGADVICGSYDESSEVKKAFGSDMMSDVLAFVDAGTLILTGTVNPHVIRTAEMVDVKYILFVRGKLPTPDIIEMAEELGIVLLATDKTMFVSCGMLYEKGLLGCSKSDKL